MAPMKRVVVVVGLLVGLVAYLAWSRDLSEDPTPRDDVAADTTDDAKTDDAPKGDRKSLLPDSFPGQDEPEEDVAPEDRDRTVTEAETNPVQGLEMVPATDADRAHAKAPDDRWGKGVLVMNVKPDSPADEVRLRKGDLIVRAQREHINSPQDLIDAAKDRDHVLVTFVREGQYLQVVLKKPFDAADD